MNKKAFTLIELLGVIVILAIILAIAIPRISSLIEQAKTNAKEAQNKLIYSSVSKYLSINNIVINPGESSVIKIGDLINAGYFKEIKNIDTNLIYEPSTGIVIKNIQGEYKYYFLGYITDGLILHHDGIYNGGYDLIKTNSSLDKNIWNDLTNSQSNATLGNFDYNTLSGWNNKGLKFDGSNDTLISNILNTYSKGPFTIEIFLNCDVYRYVELNLGVADLKLRILGQNEYWNTRQSDLNYKNIIISYPDKIVLNSKTHYSFAHDETSNTYKYSKNNNFYTMSVSSYLKPDISLKFNGELMSGTIYAIRIYDRALSENELKQNYEIDKLRF